VEGDPVEVVVARKEHEVVHLLGALTASRAKIIVPLDVTISTV